MHVGLVKERSVSWDSLANVSMSFAESTDMLKIMLAISITDNNNKQN